MFKLPDLPFDKSALEPFMSRQTLETHHGKHHAAYIKKLNAALETRAGKPATLEEAVRLGARENNKAIFNNAAQAWNHAFFWQSLTPDGPVEPQGALRAALERAFDSLGAFRSAAKTQGESHFASGWLWLMADGAGAVSLRDTHDAHTPLEHANAPETPLLVCDLWEHAYYLDYKNERGAFLEAFLNKIANWRFAERQYDAAKRGGEGAWVFPG